MGKRAGKRNKRGKRGGKRKASSIESTENSGDDMETNKTIDDTNTAVDEQSTADTLQQSTQQVVHQQKQTSNFLPEPFPKAPTSSTQHLHDAYGNGNADDLNDEGVDYGPPNEFEEVDDDDEEGSKSEELKQQNDSSADVMDMNVDIKEQSELAIQQQDDTKSTSLQESNTSQQNQEQLEEEQLEETLELHTTTLQTLHTKLQSLSTSITTEHNYNSELVTDIQLLQKRKVIFKKKTDKNIKLVKELECNLDKCLGRLRNALDELNDGEEGLDDELGLGEEDVYPEAAQLADDVADASSPSPPTFAEDVDNEPAKDSKLDQHPIRSTATQYNIKIIPLKSNPHQQTPNISWPSTKLVTKRYNEIQSLSTNNIGIPTTHLTILSSGGSSILGGLNNIQLIVNVMNVAALENLLQRDKYEGSNEMTRRNEQQRNNNSSCGLVKESDIWGTSLDVYTHVNWKTLLAGFTRRIEEDDEQQQQSGVEGLTSSKTDRNECRVVDPNTILCPYELGGECADGQCPYQHLKQRGDGDVQGRSSNSLREGYVRYNNLPKTKLPRSFVKEDFVISGAEVQDDDTTADMSHNDKEEERIEDKRRFHCPICVVDNNDQSSSTPYSSQEELQTHMAECHKQSSSQTANGKSVTIQHTLLTADAGAIRNKEILKRYAAKNEQNDSSSDDNSTSDNEDEQEQKSTWGDDTSMTSHQNDNGSAPTVAEEDDDKLYAGVEDNLDYVSLPSVADSVESTSNQGGYIDNSHKSAKKRTTIFNNTFWWQQIGSFLIPEDAIKECQDSFHSLLLSFGFQYLRNEEGSGHSLGCIMPILSGADQVNDILLFSRLVDLSRVLVHMGRFSFALVVMNRIEIRNDTHPLICRPYWRAYQTVKSLIQSQNSAYTLFQVQVQLLVLSEYLRTNYDSLLGNDAPCLNQLLVDQILNLHDVGKYSKNNLFPEGLDRLRQNLVSHLPSANNDKSNGGDDWASFIKTLKHIIEKFIIVPFSQIGTDDQFLFLLRSVCIGKYLGNNIVHNASKERGFVSYLHALEPVWSSLQPLLQVSLTSACSRWLQPDVVAIVLIGPIIFSCVADMVASSDSGKKASPKFDARARANLSTLDNFIVGIIKDLNRFGRSRGYSQLVEPLLAPLYTLSTTISVALGSFDKAHVRLEHVLSKEVEEKPSLYALSDLIWSQLVQLRVLCPSYSTPLDTSDAISKQMSLPDRITKPHHELAHRIVENGIFLWGVKLRGDSNMNIISPCFNKNHCMEWEKAATQIFTYHEGSSGEQASQPSLEFSISDPYPEELEGIRTSRESVFPDSLLLLGKSLSSLTLDKCGLTRLPLSIGYHLTNLKVSCFVPYHSLSNLFILLALALSQRHAGNTQHKTLNLANNLLFELPDSICCMEQLEIINLSYNKLKTFPKQLSQCSKLRVIDVSYNQLDTFPADLALQLNNLESFIVDGNPAAVSSPPSAKRQKVGKDWGELF